MFGLVAEELHVVMAEVRERTFALVAHLDEAQLNSTLNPIMSPLSWDLGHMAAYEDLWLNHRAAGRDLLREDLAALYDAFETPRAVRGDLEFLRGEELLAYMAEVRARALEAPVSDLHELVIRHELQHTETMLQAMAMAGITPPSFSGPPAVDGSGLEMIETSWASAHAYLGFQ
jgi:iron(II)-dependent oxidoreductase